MDKEWINKEIITQMKTILLLGGYGFIGTNLMKWVDKRHLPYRFVVFDKFIQHPAGVQFDCIKSAYAGDFSDASCMEQIFADNQIDMVIHSLSSTVPLNAGNARYDIESNLLPTLSLLDTMVRHDVKDIVFFSSGGAVYGESEMGKPHKETDELYPKSSYGVVKLAIEKYMFLYKSLYGIRPLVLRLSNPYGKYHYSQRQGIINIALRAAQAGKPFTVWGDGTATKDYIFVEDVCNVVFQLIDKQISNEVINVASGELLSVNQILNQIKKLYPDFQWKYQSSNLSDVKRVELDTKKMKESVDVNCRLFNNLTSEWL